MCRDAAPYARAAAGLKARFAEHRPCVVICDWRMPGVDGLEVCRRIRAAEDQRYVYVVLLTVHVEKGHLVEAFDAGVDDFVGEPIEEAELLARIRAGMRAIA